MDATTNAEAGPVERPVGPHADPTTDWPCAKLNVDDSGLVVRAGLYAPGLPAGDHDVWCVPVDCLSTDPDGDVSLDWRTQDGDMLSISVGPDGKAPMAWHFGDERGSATVMLPPQVFSILRKLVRE